MHRVAGLAAAKRIGGMGGAAPGPVVGERNRVYRPGRAGLPPQQRRLPRPVADHIDKLRMVANPHPCAERVSIAPAGVVGGADRHPLAERLVGHIVGWIGEPLHGLGVGHVAAEDDRPVGDLLDGFAVSEAKLSPHEKRGREGVGRGVVGLPRRLDHSPDQPADLVARTFPRQDLHEGGNFLQADRCAHHSVRDQTA